MQSQLDHPVDLKHYARILVRRRWIILLCVVATFCASLVSLAFVPRQYQSSATLLIEERKPLVRELEQVIGGLGAAGSDRRTEEQRIAQIIGYVRSRPFLERVVKILKMTEDPTLRERAKARQTRYPELSVDEIGVRLLVEHLQKRIGVGSSGPGLYTFVVRDYTPGTAQLISKWISELFIDLTMQKELERIRAARNFGADQLRVYQEQLSSSENALEQYQSSIIQRGLNNMLVRPENLGAAENLYRRLSDDASTARARVGPFFRAASDAGIATVETLLREDPDITSLTDKFRNALDRKMEAELSAVSSPGGLSSANATLAGSRTQLYQGLEGKAETLRPDASSESRRSLAAYVFADVDATAQRNAAENLKRSIDSLTRSARSQPAANIELTRLQNDVERNRQLLQSFQAQMIASDISQAVETTDLGLRIEIVDPAQLPLEPSWPNRKKILVLAALLGPVLGVGFAFLSEMLDPTLRTLEDIQRVAPEPVLGTLPLLDETMTRQTGFRRYWLPVTLGGLVVLTAVFFTIRATVFPGLGASVTPVQAVEPVEGLTR